MTSQNGQTTQYRT